MSYLDDYLNSDYAKELNKSGKKLMRYSVLFPYYKNYLLNKIIRIFEYSSLPFEQRHLEIPLLINGFCWVTKAPSGKLIANFGTEGIRDDIYYSDVKTGFCHTTKLGDLECINGKNAVYIRNNSNRDGIMAIVNIYADLLTHIDITFKNSLVNYRSIQVFKSSTGSTAESIRKFINDRFEGVQSQIVDDLVDMISIEDLGRVSYNFNQFEELKEKILIAFYKEFGIKTESEKKERLVVDEVNEDNNAMDVMISDMLECRAQGLEECRKLWPDAFATTSVAARVTYNKEGAGINEDK